MERAEVIRLVAADIPDGVRGTILIPTGYSPIEAPVPTAVQNIWVEVGTVAPLPIDQAEVIEASIGEYAATIGILFGLHC